MRNAEGLLLGILCNLHHFAPRQDWPSASLSLAEVVPVFWRSPTVAVQMVGHVRNFLACRDAGAFLEDFIQAVEGERTKK